MFNMMHMIGDASGETTNGLWHYPMMAGFGPGFNWLFSFFWLTTWALFIIALVAAIRWLWKKGS